MDRWESFPAEDVERAFERFTGSGSTMAAPIALLVARGDLNLYTDVRPNEEDSPPDELVERHESNEHVSEKEGRRHLRQKVALAEYFESVGFDVPKKKSEPVEYDCFEVPVNGHTADVYAESDTGCVVGEVGYVKSQYALKSFGYSMLGSYHSIESMKEGLERTSASDVSHFVTAPYREQSVEESRYFVLESTENMPEPKVGAIADAIDEVRGRDNPN